MLHIERAVIRAGDVAAIADCSFDAAPGEAWALIGAGARRLLRSPERMRLFNVAMGVLLLLSVVPVLLEDW